MGGLFPSGTDRPVTACWETPGQETVHCLLHHSWTQWKCRSYQFSRPSLLSSETHVGNSLTRLHFLKSDARTGPPLTTLTSLNIGRFYASSTNITKCHSSKSSTTSAASVPGNPPPPHPIVLISVSHQRQDAATAMPKPLPHSPNPSSVFSNAHPLPRSVQKDLAPLRLDLRVKLKKAIWCGMTIGITIGIRI